MTSLARALPWILRAWRLAPRRLVLLDYDGTLAPIASRPSAARTLPGLLPLLRRLARHPGVRLGIVTGRSMRDIGRRLPLTRVAVAACHGYQMRLPGRSLRSHVSPAARRGLRTLASELRAALRALPGVLVEDKGEVLAIHTRRAAKSASREAGRIVAAHASAGRRAHIRGKAVMEIRPCPLRDKGMAVREIWRAAGRPAFVICIGDDETDESAFRTLGRRAVTVRVGSPHSRSYARYSARSPGEIARVLRRLWHELPEAAPGPGTG